MGHRLQLAIARRVGLFVVSALALSALGAATARAQDTDSTRANAKVLFERGVANYAAGQYASALGNFQEAFRVRPHPLVNVNIANCYDKLGKPLEALSHFQRFLAGDAGTPAQRDEVTAAIERLKQQVGKVVLRITPDGALAVFDQGEQYKAPLPEAVSLEAGKHTLEVRMPGYATVQRALTVRGGSTLELTIALERDAGGAAVAAADPSPAVPQARLMITPAAEAPANAAAPTPADPAPTPAQPPPQETAPAPHSEPTRAPRSASGLPKRVWIAGGIGLALAAAGTITGLLAVNANSDFEAARSTRFDVTATGLQRLAAYNEARDAASSASALALTTDILLSGALIGAALTVYFVATAQPERKPASAQITPLLSTRLAGLQLRTQL